MLAPMTPVPIQPMRVLPGAMFVVGMRIPRAVVFATGWERRTAREYARGDSISAGQSACHGSHQGVGSRFRDESTFNFAGRFVAKSTPDPLSRQCQLRTIC